MVAKLRLFLIGLVGVAMAAGGFNSAQGANPIEPFPYFLWKIDATANNITLAWYPIGGAKSYGVCVTPTSKSTFVKTCGNGSWTRVYPNRDNPGSPNNNNQNYNFGTVGGLERGTSYRIQVRAYGDTASTYAKRLTDYSPATTYSTDSVASNTPPGSFAVSGSRGGILEATWDQIGNSNYEVRFAQGTDPSRPSGAAACNPGSCVRTPVRSAKVTGLVQGGTYRVAVRAVDSKSGSGTNPIPRSPWTSIKSVTLPNLNAFSLDPPSWNGAERGPTDGFTVDWNAPAGFSPSAHRFVVFVSDESGITSGRTNAWLTTADSLHVRSGEGTPVFGTGWATLSPTSTYSLNVAVVPAGFDVNQAVGNASYIDAQLLSNYPPQIRFSDSGVGDIAVGSAKVAGLNRLKLSWDEVPGVQLYKMWLDGNGLNSGSESICVTDDVLGDGTVSWVLGDSYSLEGGSSKKLDPLTTYFVTVAAAEDECNTVTGAWLDNWLPVKTPNWYDLDAPSPFRMVASGTSAIKFEWDQDTKSLNPRYRIEYRKGSGSWSSKVTAANVQNVTVSGLTSSTYHWRVRAVEADGTTPLSPWSVEITVKPSNGNGTISGEVMNPGTAGTSTLGAFAYVQYGPNEGTLAGGVRVGSDGRYTISGLVPGTYYRVHLEQLALGSTYVSPWVNPDETNGARSREEVPTSYHVAPCADAADVCPTVTTRTTQVLQGVTISGNLPSAYGVVDMSVLYPQNNGAQVGNARVDTSVASPTYSIGGLWPSAMAGGTYRVQLSVDGTVKAAKTTGQMSANRVVDFKNLVPPASPTALTKNVTGPTTATISWHGPADADGYRLFYGPNADGSSATKQEGGSSTSMNLSGLTPGATYWISVATLRGEPPNVEVSDYTSRISFATPTGIVPGEPSDFVVDGTPDPTSVTLKWDAGSNAIRYRVWYGPNSDGSGASPIETNNTHVTINDLSPGSTYHASIASINGDEFSDYIPNPRLTFTTAPYSGSDGPLVRPSNLRISGSNLSTKTLTFAWNAGTAYGYRLYWGKNHDGRGLSGPEVGAGANFTTSSGLSNDCYYATLTTARSDGSTNGSLWTLGNEVAAAFPQPTSFGTPKCANMYGPSGLSGQLSMSWAQVPGADGYRIYYGWGSKAALGSGMTRLDVGNVGHTMITGLIPGRKYYAKITAKRDADSWSSYTGNGAVTGTP